MQAASLPYDDAFYSEQSQGSARSAQEILPILFELYRPASMVDFGCGVGTWLKVARDLGVARLRGYEGPWVTSGQLVVSDLEFINARIGQPLETDRFDLAICMEVAEHLPPPEGRTLIANLRNSADVVLFSAAIPDQGGTDHLNEQRQSFWAREFNDQGFDCFDPIRPRIWDRPAVEYWYRQNTLLYARRGTPVCDAGRFGPPPAILDLVHPAALAIAEKSARSSVRRLLHKGRQKLPRALR